MDENTSAIAPVSYEKIYTDALALLNKEIRENKPVSDENVKFRYVSLGRKGVKLYECLLKHYPEKVVNKNDKEGEEENRIDVISEHALPFITRNGIGKDVYCLLDDALYYGSSAIGVAKTVYAFEKIYGKHTLPGKKIDYFSAINTDELRLNFNRYIGEVKAVNTNEMGLRQGYSHYFVKRLSSDIRSFENTFEIEFPIITYRLDTCPNKENWEHGLSAVYRDRRANVYTVNHKENYSVNVLLAKGNGGSFTKMRLFPNSHDSGNPNRVKVVCMSPHPIADEEIILQQIFDYADKGYKEIWDRIYDNCHIDISRINSDNIIDYLSIARPRCNKSLVIMANYLLSFSIAVEQRNRLEELFGRLGVKAVFDGVDNEKDLYYLLGDAELSKWVADKLRMLYEQRRPCGTVYTDEGLRVNYPVFENSKNIDERTMFLLGVQNDYMLEMSQNIEEVLGVLFFNQDMFFEKQELASNPITQDYNRLRMGYTYQGLYDSLEDALARGYFTLGADEDFTTAIHRWIDQRIGEASIVPQYVLDDKSKHWLRVFRHGENEETLLSHLARFVLLIFNEYDDKTYLGWIRRDKFENLLVLAFNKIIGDCYKEKKGQIVESTNIDIKVEGDKLKFTNSHYDTNSKEGAPREVLQYMIDMCILSEDEDNVITIHPRIKSFLKTGITTMDSASETAIREEVRKAV